MNETRKKKLMYRVSREQTFRRIVASYDSYAEAQRAVDYLSDEKFPVNRLSIVAENLRFVEQVTGASATVGRR